MRLSSFFRDEARHPGLDNELKQWKALQSGQAPSKLSESARQRILRAAAEGPEAKGSSPWAPLFIPASRLLAAGAAPALLLAAAIGFGVQADRPTESPKIARLEVSKAEGEVVFEIQNGNRSHRVYRMEPGGASEGWELIDTTRGVFRDRIREDSGLVIYRID